MKSLRVVAVTLVMFLALGVASVYANPDGNLGLPILGTTGAPALAAPSLFSGAISVLYADGTPVVLQTNQITLNLCTASSNQTATKNQATYFNFANQTGCETVTASLKQTAPGTYTYSFTPPTSMTGTVTIYIVANGLADDNGRVFPSVDTSIGTYAFSPSTSSTAQQPAASAPPAGTPVAPLTRQAVNTNQSPPTTTSPVEALLLTLSALTIAGTLLVIPKRH
jgi:hypothetical protein